MVSKRGSMTLEELQLQLADDPEYQAMRVAKDRKSSDMAEQSKREQQPLLKELATAGVIVDWVGELLRIPSLDARVYAVLLDHITKPYSPSLLEWIGRAFGHRSDRPIVWDALINLLKDYSLDGKSGRRRHGCNFRHCTA
jgi:hypothetical protein